MKKLIFIALIVAWLPAFGQSNNFTGKIIYEYQFQEPQTEKDITNQMSQSFGKEQHYFVNAHNYKAYDENGKLKQLYNSDTNKYYFENPNTGQLMVLDAKTTIAEIVSVQHSDETKEILGRLCKKVTVKTTRDETVYWYSSEIKVNPENFTNHKFGGWSTYLKETNGALPLKYTVKNPNFTWITTVTDIKEMELNKTDFAINQEMNKN